MREPSQAPPEFVSYVDRRLRALESAALRLTGDDAQAERIARELMTLAAVRWRSLSRADARHGLAEGESADVYLAKLFHQEAGEFGYPKMVLKLDATVPGRRRSTLSGALPASDEAELIWEAARRKLRRRLLIAAGAGAVVAVAALCRRGGSQPPPPQVQPPLEQSTALPPGAFTAPREALGMSQIVGIPDPLEVPAERPPALTAGPAGIGVLLLAGSPNVDDGRVYALFDDGQWRHIDAAPNRAAVWMGAGALSPNGRRAVFGTPTETVLVDLTTGQGRDLTDLRTAMRPVWLTDDRLLLSGESVLDLAADEVVAAAAGPEDAICPRGRGSDLLIELLSPGRPLTAPARVQRWEQGLPDPQPVTIPLSGPLAGMIGPWEGPGFGFGEDRVVRVCEPGTIPGSRAVTSVVAVVDPRSGTVAKVLLLDGAESGVPRMLGWESERRVLLSLHLAGTQRIVAWDLLADQLTVASTSDFDGAVSIRDLTRVA